MNALLHSRKFIDTFIHLLSSSSSSQAQNGELDTLNQRAQDILRQADSINRTQIESENTQINKDWKTTVYELENRIETLRELSEHWDEFDKRIHSFENKLVRLDERNRNVDAVVRSKQHLEDTKNVIQVSRTVLLLDSEFFVNLNIFDIETLERRTMSAPRIPSNVNRIQTAKAKLVCRITIISLISRRRVKT